MNMNTITTFWRAALLGGLLTAGASATVLADNLGEFSTGADNVSGNGMAALSFTTDNHTYLVRQATLRLSIGGGGSPLPLLGIYTNGPGGIVGAPGQLVGGLAPAGAMTETPALVTFHTPGFELAPNSRYWAVLVTTNVAVAWHYTQSNNGSGPGFDTNWLLHRDGGAWEGYNESPYQMRLEADIVEASGVPEPSTWVMLGSVAPVVLAFRRRRVR